MNDNGDIKRKRLRRIMIGMILMTAFIAFRAFDLGQYLTLSFLKESEANFALLYRSHKVAVIFAYAAFYILATSLSLPGALVLTLAGGALFGLWVGTLVVSFASTIGAVLSCLVSRFILRDWVQARFRNILTTVNEGIEREGTFYLFALRLIPVFPFWLINLVIGLTKMPVRRIYWVSQLGMLPATIIYVNAGRELARIDSLSDILSPGLITSLVLLGLFPLIVKRGLSAFRGRRQKKAI